MYHFFVIVGCGFSSKPLEHFILNYQLGTTLHTVLLNELDTLLPGLYHGIYIFFSLIVWNLRKLKNFFLTKPNHMNMKTETVLYCSQYIFLCKRLPILRNTCTFIWLQMLLISKVIPPSLQDTKIYSLVSW